MSNLQQLEKNVSYAAQANSIPAAERAALIERSHSLRELNDLYCTNCNYCFVCPEKIRIGRIFQLYIQHHVWGLSDTIAARLAGISSGPWAQSFTDPEKCTECGACLQRCPQKIDIPNELKRVWPILKGLSS